MHAALTLDVSRTARDGAGLHGAPASPTPRHSPWPSRRGERWGTLLKGSPPAPLPYGSGADPPKMHSGATGWPLPAASASACHGCGHRAAGGRCPPAPLYPWCGGARRAVACLGSQKSRAKAAARRWRALDFCQPRPIATQRGGTLRRRTAARNAGRTKECGQKSTPRALF